MTVEIKVTKLLNNAHSAKIVRIFKKPNDKIVVGETLFELEANKSNITIKSQYDGEIISIAVKVGQTVKVGDVLAVLKKEQTVSGNIAVDNKHKAISSPHQAKSGADYFNILPQPQRQQLECDIAILGGGPGGYVAAIQGAQMGAQVVLVERNDLGGTCLNRGCIPTKALVHSAKIFHQLQNAKHHGYGVENISVEFEKIMDKKNDIVSQLRRGIAHLLQKNSVIVVSGAGELQDQKTLRVKNNRQETIISAHHIIIATGSVPSHLPVPGTNLAGVLTTEQVLQLNQLPGSMAIIGGGVIGMEYAFMMANLGVHVTILELFESCLAGLDQDICQEITRIAHSKGIRVYNNIQVKEITQTEDGRCLVLFNQAQQRKYLPADKVLLAVGRQPSYPGVDVAELGLQLNLSRRGIQVNNRMQTNIPHIYAIGDVTDTIMLAHVASHQGIVAVKNIMGTYCAMDYHAVPSAVFTDPEIAVVGVSEKDAQEKDITVKVSKVPFSISGRALTTGEDQGFVKIIQDDGEKLIGAAVMGPRASDLIAPLTLAVQNKLTARHITQTIHAHPTNAEVIWEAALALQQDSAIHI